MKTSRIIFAAVFAGALLASCAPKEEQELISDLPEIVAEAQPMFVSINASKAIDTKALAIVGTALKSTWEDGETVGVYKVGDSKTKYGTLAPATFGSNTTRLEGTIDVAGLSAGDQLFLLYPDRPWYYYGQDGTLATISSSYDFATATVAISSVDSDHLSAESAAFSNKQAIVKFSLKEKGAGAISASGFTILSKNKKLVDSYNLLFEPDESDNLSVKLNPEAPVSELTLAVATSGGAADDYGFYASTMDASFKETLYEFIKEGVTFENGKYYTVNLSNMEEVHYVAAGSPASVFGEEWNPTREANELQFNGSYFATIDIPGPCQIEFKVVRNGTAYYPFPEGGPETNIKVAALGKGSIDIVMNPITKEVSYKVHYDSTPETSWTVAGAVGGVTDGGQDDPVFGKTWDPFVTANDMTASGSKFVKTFSAVPAGTEMEFKIVKDRDWNGEVYGGDANANYYYKVLADGDVTITFDPAGPTITVDGPAAPADVYTVAGAPAAIFGTEWDNANTANDLLKQSDGAYLKQYDVTSAPADPISFKILKDHVWGNAGENNWPIENYSYQIPKAGTLNIWFNPESKKIEAWMDDERYSIAGSFNGWDTAANFMALQSDGTYKCVIPNVTAGDHEYKLVTGGTKWAEGDNSHYVLSSPCDLEFIYNPITGVFSFNELRVALYYTFKRAVSDAVGLQSETDLQTAGWPGSTSAGQETIAGSVFYKWLFPASLIWGKTPSYRFVDAGNYDTPYVNLAVSSTEEAYYFEVGADKSIRQFDGRPDDWSFVSKFGVDWSAVTAVAAGRTDSPYDGIEVLKATGDASRVFLLVQVKKASLYAEPTYEYANLCKLYLGDENSTTAFDWQWTSKYTKKFNSWMQTGGVPKFTTFDCSGLDSKVDEYSVKYTDETITTVYYELAIPRSFDACLQGTAATVAMEINQQYVLGDWAGSSTQIGFAPKCWQDALSFTLPAYTE